MVGCPSLGLPALPSFPAHTFLRPPRVPGEDQVGGGWGEGRKSHRRNPDLPVGWHSEQRRKGRREESALSTKKDTKAPSCARRGERSERGMRCLQDRPRGPAGRLGWRSDQGMWLLVFNFHLSQISLPKISGLKGRVGTSGSALRMRVWRSLTVTSGCALGRDGPGVPLGLWGWGQPGAKGRCPSKLGTPPALIKAL